MDAYRAAFATQLQQQLAAFQHACEYKRFIVATDAEFGPSWAARNHSQTTVVFQEQDFQGRLQRAVPRRAGEDAHFVEKVL
jgi:hypothetical protein